MRILLLGGTGAIGNHLVKDLLRNHNEIFVTSRSSRSDSAYVTFIQGNAHSIEFIKEITKQRWDVIVDFMNRDETGLRDCISYLLENTDKYVFISSSRVYADTGDELITESSPLLIDTAKDIWYLQSNEYGLSKAKQERILRNSSYDNWVIVRPYITYDTYRLQLGALEKEDWLYRAIHGKNLVLQETLKDKVTTLTYAGDVSAVIARIIVDNDSNGHTYNIANSYENSVSWQDVLDIYQSVLKKELGIAVDLRYLSEIEYNKFRTEYSQYQVTYDRKYNRRFDISSTIKYKDIDSYMPTDEGLTRCLTEFLHNPRFLFTNQKQEALLDSFSHQFSNIMHINGIRQKLAYMYYRALYTF